MPPISPSAAKPNFLIFILLLIVHWPLARHTLATNLLIAGMSAFLRPSRFSFLNLWKTLLALSAKDKSSATLQVTTLAAVLPATDVNNLYAGLTFFSRFAAFSSSVSLLAKKCVSVTAIKTLETTCRPLRTHLELPPSNPRFCIWTTCEASKFSIIDSVLKGVCVAAGRASNTATGALHLRKLAKHNVSLCVAMTHFNRLSSPSLNTLLNSHPSHSKSSTCIELVESKTIFLLSSLPKPLPSFKQNALFKIESSRGFIHWWICVPSPSWLLIFLRKPLSPSVLADLLLFSKTLCSTATTSSTFPRGSLQIFLQNLYNFVHPLLPIWKGHFSPLSSNLHCICAVSSHFPCGPEQLATHLPVFHKFSQNCSLLHSG